jgi:hypothetical protein
MYWKYMGDFRLIAKNMIRSVNKIFRGYLTFKIHRGQVYEHNSSWRGKWRRHWKRWYKQVAKKPFKLRLSKGQIRYAMKKFGGKFSDLKNHRRLHWIWNFKKVSATGFKLYIKFRRGRSHRMFWKYMGYFRLIGKNIMRSTHKIYRGYLTFKIIRGQVYEHNSSWRGRWRRHWKRWYKQGK